MMYFSHYKNYILFISLLAIAMLANTLSVPVCFANGLMIVDEVVGDLDDNGFKEKICLVAALSKEDETNGTLKVRSMDKEYEINVGVLDSLEKSSIEMMRIAKNIKPFIVLFLPGGAHGLRAVLYSFNGMRIKKEADMFSDAPSIEFKDVDKDGTKEIVSKNRDYDHDPIVDSSVEVYKYTDGRWRCINNYKMKNN